MWQTLYLPQRIVGKMKWIITWKTFRTVPGICKPFLKYASKQQKPIQKSLQTNQKQQLNKSNVSSSKLIYLLWFIYINGSVFRFYCFIDLIVSIPSVLIMITLRYFYYLKGHIPLLLFNDVLTYWLFFFCTDEFRIIFLSSVRHTSWWVP